MQRYTIHQFNDDFPDDDACLEHVARLVYASWPDVHCRKCEEVTHHYRIKGRKAFSCQKCGTHVYPLAGTIFEKSSTALKSWFYAMYLMSTTRAGISAKQLERELGVTYKTAWRMFKQIRVLMAEDPGEFFGDVEMDEAYFGGKRKSGTGRPGSDSSKAAVAGIVERRKTGGARTGRVSATVVPDVTGDTLMPILKARTIRPITVFTDDYNVYRRVGRELMMHHRRINHSSGVYVNGNIHTNSVEGFWSLVKNGIRGVYHSVGRDYLQTYLNEYSFRYNHRGDVAPMFEAIKVRVPQVRAGQHGGYAPLPR